MPVVSGIELSDADLAAFREVFDLVDKDKSGAIETEEVEELTKLLGLDLTRDEVELLVREIDKDGNGEVDFEEFLLVMAGGERKGRCGKKDMLGPSGPSPTSRSRTGSYPRGPSSTRWSSTARRTAG